MKKQVIIFILLVIVGLSCKDKNKDFIITIHTTHGDMKVLLFEETPLHKENFVNLANAGRYDSVEWHRIIEGFMIQGGDIYSKEGSQENKEDRIPAEIVEGFTHTKGALAAARQGDQANPERKSSSSQFYIVQGSSWEMMSTDIRLLNAKMSVLLQQPEYEDLLKQFQEIASRRDSKAMSQLAFEQKALVEEKFGIDLTIDPQTKDNEAYKKAGGSSHLDGAYTVFGRVVSGLEVIDKIASVKTGRGDRPIEPIYMTMDVDLVSKKEITKLYGYQYPAE